MDQDSRTTSGCIVQFMGLSSGINIYMYGTVLSEPTENMYSLFAVSGSPNDLESDSK